MLLENRDGIAQDDSLPPAEQPSDADDCGVTSGGSSSQPASPAASDVTPAGQLPSRLSNSWDAALRRERATAPAVDDPLHRGMLVFWVDPQEMKPSELAPISLIAIIGEDGTLTEVDYPLKIGDYTFLVPDCQSPIRTDSESDDSGSDTEVDSCPSVALGPTTRQTGSRQRRLLTAISDINDGLYIDCLDFEQYARALLDAEVTVVRNVLSSWRPETDREHSQLWELQTLCERRWSEEPALDIVDKLGCQLLDNRGLVEFLVSHLRLLLGTQPELIKLQHTLPRILQTELLKIQTDFLAARIAARSQELQPESPETAGVVRASSDVSTTPYGPFGTPPRPQRWDW